MLDGIVELVNFNPAPAVIVMCVGLLAGYVWRDVAFIVALVAGAVIIVGQSGYVTDSIASRGLLNTINTWALILVTSIAVGILLNFFRRM
jgi:uncharacterized protein HemY